MPHIISDFQKWYPGFLRREYTRNLQDGYGDYYPCIMHGLRIVGGRSIGIQCTLTHRYAGAGFLAPIEAFCWRVPDHSRKRGERVDMTYIQPWDCFSSTFGVHEFGFHRRMKCLVLPDRKPARYRFSLDFEGNALSELDEQHKHLHIVDMDDGQVGAFPNNRLLWIEPAMWPKPLEGKPDFVALAGEFMAE